jgi:hypothetical protein
LSITDGSLLLAKPSSSVLETHELDMSRVLSAAARYSCGTKDEEHDIAPAGFSAIKLEISAGAKAAM